MDEVNSIVCDHVILIPRQDVIAAHDGIVTIINAMIEQISAVGVSEHGSNALLYLALNHPSNSVRATIKSIPSLPPSLPWIPGF
jgi:hypothetical protein